MNLIKAMFGWFCITDMTSLLLCLAAAFIGTHCLFRASQHTRWWPLDLFLGLFFFFVAIRLLCCQFYKEVGDD